MSGGLGSKTFFRRDLHRPDRLWLIEENVLRRLIVNCHLGLSKSSLEAVNGGITGER